MRESTEHSDQFGCTRMTVQRRAIGPSSASTTSAAAKPPEHRGPVLGTALKQGIKAMPARSQPVKEMHGKMQSAARVAADGLTKILLVYWSIGPSAIRHRMDLHIVIAAFRRATRWKLTS